MIRLILAEDQTMLLDAFEALLHLEDDIQIVGRATDGREALDLIREHRPDVVLTDIEMPHVTGIELAEKILQENLPSRVMIVTTFGRSGYLRRALQAGVRGYMLKDAPITQLAAAIRKAAAGGRATAPELAAAVWDASPDPPCARDSHLPRPAPVRLPQR